MISVYSLFLGNACIFSCESSVESHGRSNDLLHPITDVNEITCSTANYITRDQFRLNAG